MNFFRFHIQVLIVSLMGFTYTAEGNIGFYSDSFALLIGIDKYHNWPQLNYAVADAETMQKLLTEKLDFPNDNVFMLLDEEATLLNIKKEMNRLKNIANDNDRVLIYFAGHGITEPLPKGGEEGYLVPVDGGEEDALDITALPMSEMKRVSDRVGAKDMLFLMDACFSGLMGVRGLSKEDRGTMTLRKIAEGGSRTVITAGRKDEVVQERPEWGHSVFVKNILSGLEKGMADKNDDQYITGVELGDYLRDKVTMDTDTKQTPDISYFTSDGGDFVFILRDMNVKIEDSKPYTALEIDYDKLAEKIADRMESKKSLQVEKADDKIEEITNMDLLEKEMYQLSGDMTALGEVMIELGEEMTELGEEMEEEEEEKKRNEVAKEMDELGAMMDEVGKMMDEVGEEMDALNEEMNALEVKDEDFEETDNDYKERLKKLGIDLESEEIAKITDNLRDKIKNQMGISENNLIANCTFANSQTRYYADGPEDEEEIIASDDVNNDNWWRYNRSEGLFFQMNGVFQSPNIKGSSFYGGIGRAFHRNEYQWTLGLEQLMFKNVLQFYTEVFNKSITPDAWRLWDGENSLSTVFRNQDYLD